jgi:hypothetical protein
MRVVEKILLAHLLLSVQRVALDPPGRFRPGRGPSACWQQLLEDSIHLVDCLPVLPVLEGFNEVA